MNNEEKFWKTLERFSIERKNDHLYFWTDVLGGVGFYDLRLNWFLGAAASPFMTELRSAYYSGNDRARDSLNDLEQAVFICGVIADICSDSGTVGLANKVKKALEYLSAEPTTECIQNLSA
jgi:hypothetical protein